MRVGCPSPATPLAASIGRDPEAPICGCLPGFLAPGICPSVRGDIHAMYTRLAFTMFVLNSPGPDDAVNELDARAVADIRASYTSQFADQARIHAAALAALRNDAAVAEAARAALAAQLDALTLTRQYGRGLTCFIAAG